MHGSLDELKVEVDMLTPEGERIVGKNPPLDIIARDITFGEGPVWDNRRKELIFVDIIGDTIWKWKRNGGLEVVMKPSAKADGLALDLEYRVLAAGWGGRTVFRIEKDGSRTVLADRFEGKKLNSPNDIVVSKDGAIWFTDPVGGLLNVGMVHEDIQRYNDKQPVYRITPDGKTMTVATDEIVYPNGLCFSPDEKLLYVNCSRERLIRVYDVKSDGTLGKGRLFYQYTGPERGVPDGMKCDVEGNVYCTGPGGIFVHDPEGKVLARIRTPGHHPTNFSWGDDDWRSLYITNIGSVVRTRVNVAGIPSR
ncbi:MAG TPA: SMP-30/gluconolactonase/LRE family protein [Burkholderiales bacterium]|nr:SMP-30/gluconolactonase/LRE family protein [Burkholderiales bacterium]